MNPGSWWVVLGRQFTPVDPAAVAAFAEGIDADPFTARQKLLCPAPQTLRRETDQAEAERWVAWMRSLGVASFAITDSELEASAAAPVETLKLDGEAIELGLRGRASARLPLSSLLGICHGSWHERESAEVSELDPLFGDLQRRREVRSDTIRTVFDLHSSVDARLFRFSEDGFQFASFFAPEERTGAAMMLRRLAKWLAGRAPQIRVWEGFDKVGNLAASTEAQGSSLRMAVRPMSLGMGGVRMQKTQDVRESREGAFNLFSALARAQALKG